MVLPPEENIFPQSPHWTLETSWLWVFLMWLFKVWMEAYLLGHWVQAKLSSVWLVWNVVLIFLWTMNICCFTSVLLARTSLQISQTFPQFIWRWLVRLDLEGQWIPQRWQMNSVSSLIWVSLTLSSTSSLIIFSSFSLPAGVLVSL